MKDFKYSSDGPITFSSGTVTLTNGAATRTIMGWLRGMSEQARRSLHDFVLIYTLSRQIRLLRTSRKWTQAELARRSGLSLVTINRVEKFLGCRHATMTTLCAIAAAFDVALQVRFVSWGEWVTFYFTGEGMICQGLTPQTFNIRTFSEDIEFLQLREQG